MKRAKRLIKTNSESEVRRGRSSTTSITLNKPAFPGITLHTDAELDDKPGAFPGIRNHHVNVVPAVAEKKFEPPLSARARRNTHTPRSARNASPSGTGQQKKTGHKSNRTRGASPSPVLPSLQRSASAVGSLASAVPGPGGLKGVKKIQLLQSDVVPVDVTCVLLAEFDIDHGSTLTGMYPSSVPFYDDDELADMMLPDGAQNQEWDWLQLLLTRTKEVERSTNSTSVHKDNSSTVLDEGWEVVLSTQRDRPESAESTTENRLSIANPSPLSASTSGVSHLATTSPPPISKRPSSSPSSSPVKLRVRSSSSPNVAGSPPKASWSPSSSPSPLCDSLNSNSNDDDDSENEGSPSVSRRPKRKMQRKQSSRKLSDSATDAITHTSSSTSVTAVDESNGEKSDEGSSNDTENGTADPPSTPPSLSPSLSSPSSTSSSPLPTHTKRGGKRPVLHMLNLVHCKKDTSVRRGATIRAMAIVSTYPFVQAFRPILLRALYKYFVTPCDEILSSLFHQVASLDLSKSFDVSTQLLNYGVQFKRDELFHFKDVLDVDSQAIIPIALPLNLSRDQSMVGSVLMLIKRFGVKQLMMIYNAVLLERKILFLGHNQSAGMISGYVAACVHLVCPTLRGVLESRARPYVTLSDTSWQTIPGYIAGTTNPFFEDNGACQWDLLCDINKATVVESSKTSRLKSMPDKSFVKRLKGVLQVGVVDEKEMREIFRLYTARLVDMALFLVVATDLEPNELDLNTERLDLLRKSSTFHRSIQHEQIMFASTKGAGRLASSGSHANPRALSDASVLTSSPSMGGVTVDGSDSSPVALDRRSRRGSRILAPSNVTEQFAKFNLFKKNSNGSTKVSPSPNSARRTTNPLPQLLQKTQQEQSDQKVAAALGVSRKVDAGPKPTEDAASAVNGDGDIAAVGVVVAADDEDDDTQSATGLMRQMEVIQGQTNTKVDDGDGDDNDDDDDDDDDDDSDDASDDQQESVEVAESSDDTGGVADIPKSGGGGGSGGSGGSDGGGGDDVVVGEAEFTPLPTAAVAVGVASNNTNAAAPASAPQLQAVSMPHAMVSSGSHITSSPSVSGRSRRGSVSYKKNGGGPTSIEMLLGLVTNTQTFLDVGGKVRTLHYVYQRARDEIQDDDFGVVFLNVVGNVSSDDQLTQLQYYLNKYHINAADILSRVNVEPLRTDVVVLLSRMEAAQQRLVDSLRTVLIRPM